MGKALEEYRRLIVESPSFIAEREGASRLIAGLEEEVASLEARLRELEGQDFDAEELGRYKALVERLVQEKRFQEGQLAEAHGHVRRTQDLLERREELVELVLKGAWKALESSASIVDDAHHASEALRAIARDIEAIKRANCSTNP